MKVLVNNQLVNFDALPNVGDKLSIEGDEGFRQYEVTGLKHRAGSNRTQVVEVEVASI